MSPDNTISAALLLKTDIYFVRLPLLICSSSRFITSGRRGSPAFQRPTVALLPLPPWWCPQEPLNSGRKDLQGPGVAGDLLGDAFSSECSADSPFRWSFANVTCYQCPP